MLSSKAMYVANFNLTFGKDNLPMLNHFEDILYPALKENEGIINEKDYLVFENITLTMKNDIYVLGGLIVKRTELEVMSQYDEEGNLVQTDNIISTAPYSYFMINLKNHRVVLVKNQKGSPTIKNLQKATDQIMKRYIKKNEERNLPKAYLNIVSIPFSGKIREELRKVEKIEKLVLRFYPLNGDVSTNDTFNHLRDMLEMTQSKSGHAQINTPKDHKEIGDILTETKGLVKPSLRVVYKGNVKRTLKEDSFSETSSVKLNDKDGFIDNLNTISEKAIGKEDFIDVSEENAKLYDSKLVLLESLYKGD